MILFKWNHKQNKNIQVNQIKMFEKEFVDIFLDDNVIKRLFGGDYIVVREFKSTSGIPDVMLLNKRHAEKLIEFRSKYSDMNLSKSHARVITNLSKRSFCSYGQLSKQCGLSASYTKTLLDQLELTGVVISKDKEWKLNRDFAFPKVETISLEFKLSDWQSALKQGYRYKRLATRSYVIMPSSKSQLLKKNKHHFENLDVGAVVYSRETKRIEVINKPCKTRPSNTSFFGSLSSLSDFAMLSV